MADVCLAVGSDTELTIFLNDTETLLKDFVEEFGKNCGIFNTVDTLLDEAREFVKPLEDAIKKVTDIASDFYNKINDVFSQISGLVQEGMALLKEAIAEGIALINNTINIINEAVDVLTSAIVQATNALANAACNTLSEALTGVPSDVKLKSPGALAAAAFDRADIKGSLKRAVADAGVFAAKDKLINAANELDNLAQLPDLRKFSCSPIGTVSANDPQALGDILRITL